MLLRRNRKKAIPSPGNGSRDLVQLAIACRVNIGFVFLYKLWN